MAPLPPARRAAHPAAATLQHVSLTALLLASAASSSSAAAAAASPVPPRPDYLGLAARFLPGVDAAYTARSCGAATAKVPCNSAAELAAAHVALWRTRGGAANATAVARASELMGWFVASWATATQNGTRRNNDTFDFFALTIHVSDIPADATYLLTFNRLRSDGDAPTGPIDQLWASGTADFAYNDTSGYEDGGDYEIVVESIAGASCAHGYLLAIAQ